MRIICLRWIKNSENIPPALRGPAEFGGFRGRGGTAPGARAGPQPEQERQRRAPPQRPSRSGSSRPRRARSPRQPQSRPGPPAPRPPTDTGPKARFHRREQPRLGPAVRDGPGPGERGEAASDGPAPTAGRAGLREAGPGLREAGPGVGPEVGPGAVPGAGPGPAQVRGAGLAQPRCGPAHLSRPRPSHLSRPHPSHLSRPRPARTRKSRRIRPRSALCDGCSSRDAAGPSLERCAELRTGSCSRCCAGLEALRRAAHSRSRRWIAAGSGRGAGTARADPGSPQAPPLPQRRRPAGRPLADTERGCERGGPRGALPARPPRGCGAPSAPVPPRPPRAERDPDPVPAPPGLSPAASPRYERGCIAAGRRSPPGPGAGAEPGAAAHAPTVPGAGTGPCPGSVLLGPLT
ncbi:basic salivary proline-rich protein 4-like [Agelaius tricolor]|uniref:basic salivary proline-rich protein 4-like n=1 Tax=Agelaius tricolor TaxID=9191 RepID=UPI0039F2417F